MIPHHLTGLAVFALHMASTRCFLADIAMLALAILLFAMAASRGSSAQAITDTLLINTGTNMAFGSVPWAVICAMDIGTTTEASPLLASSSVAKHRLLWFSSCTTRVRRRLVINCVLTDC
jgi:hypothetical protein